MKLPQGVTWASLLIALLIWLVDPRNEPLLTSALGAHAVLYIISGATLLAALGRSVLGSAGKFPKGFTWAGVLFAAIAVVADTQYHAQLTAFLGEQAANSLAAIGALLASVGAALGGVSPTPPTLPTPPDQGTP